MPPGLQPRKLKLLRRHQAQRHVALDLVMLQSQKTRLTACLVGSCQWPKTLVPRRECIPSVRSGTTIGSGSVRPFCNDMPISAQRSPLHHRLGFFSL